MISNMQLVVNVNLYLVCCSTRSGSLQHPHLSPATIELADFTIWPAATSMSSYKREYYYVLLYSLQPMRRRYEPMLTKAGVCSPVGRDSPMVQAVALCAGEVGTTSRPPSHNQYLHKCDMVNICIITSTYLDVAFVHIRPTAMVGSCLGQVRQVPNKSLEIRTVVRYRYYILCQHPVLAGKFKEIFYLSRVLAEQTIKYKVKYFINLCISPQT